MPASPPRCALARARSGALPRLLLLALVPGCALLREIGVGGDDPQWRERRYRDVGCNDALRLAQSVVARDYPVRRIDWSEGEIECDWMYGLWSDLTRQALRQRAWVEVEAEDETRIRLRVRVQQQTNEEAGRFADALDEGWRAWEDDALRAETLLMKMHIVLKEVGTPVDAEGKPLAAAADERGAPAPR